MFLLGVVIIQADLSRWVGWVLVGAALLFLLLYVALRDLPPFVHYLLGLVFGSVLIGET